MKARTKRGYHEQNSRASKLGRKPINRAKRGGNHRAPETEKTPRQRPASRWPQGGRSTVRGGKKDTARGKRKRPIEHMGGWGEVKSFKSPWTRKVDAEKKNAFNKGRSRARQQKRRRPEWGRKKWGRERARSVCN